MWLPLLDTYYINNIQGGWTRKLISSYMDDVHRVSYKRELENVPVDRNKTYDFLLNPSFQIYPFTWLWNVSSTITDLQKWGTCLPW